MVGQLGVRRPMTAKKLSRLARLLSRHASLILRRPTTIIANYLDRGHLLVALLREATSLLTTGTLKPHFAFLVGQIGQLNASFKEYLHLKYGQAGEVSFFLVNFERLNLDLLLYEANRTSVEILNKDFDEPHGKCFCCLLTKFTTNHFIFQNLSSPT